MENIDKDLLKKGNITKNLSLSEEEQRIFGRLIKIGVCKELHYRKLLDDEQLNMLLERFYSD